MAKRRGKDKEVTKDMKLCPPQRTTRVHTTVMAMVFHGTNPIKKTEITAHPSSQAQECCQATHSTMPRQNIVAWGISLTVSHTTATRSKLNTQSVFTADRCAVSEWLNQIQAVRWTTHTAARNCNISWVAPLNVIQLKNLYPRPSMRLSGVMNM